MKRTLFLIILIFHVCLTGAQKYLDSEFNFTDPEHATYYQYSDSFALTCKKTTYFMDNKLYSIQYFSSLNPVPVRHGKLMQYYKNGQLHYEVDYFNDKLHGKVTGYYENGRCKRRDIYRNDSLLAGICYTKDGKETEHYYYNKPPKFQGGGISEFSKYISNKIVSPENNANQYNKGIVVVELGINPKGYIVNPKIVSSPDESIGEEVYRAVLLSPRWEPGIIDGKETVYKIIVPVRFEF